DKSGTHDTIEVAVKPETPVKVSFLFVKHQPRPGVMEKYTKWDIADASGWVGKMNAVFLPQANIRIVLQNARYVLIDKDFGPDIGYVSKATVKDYDKQLAQMKGLPADVRQKEHDDFVALRESDDLARKKDNTADVNVFMVRLIRTWDSRTLSHLPGGKYDPETK